MIIDYRCPACNRPVDGSRTEDVRIANRLPEVTPGICKRCGTLVKLVESDPEQGYDVKCYHFTDA